MTIRPEEAGPMDSHDPEAVIACRESRAAIDNAKRAKWLADVGKREQTAQDQRAAVDRVKEATLRGIPADPADVELAFEERLRR